MCRVSCVVRMLMLMRVSDIIEAINGSYLLYAKLNNAKQFENKDSFVIDWLIDSFDSMIHSFEFIYFSVELVDYTHHFSFREDVLMKHQSKTKRLST